MIFLNTYTKSLQIVSSVADLHWTASWIDKVSDCQKPNVISETDKENQGLTINGIVTMITAPTKNDNTKTYSKAIEYINCYNSSNTSSTISVEIDDNGTSRILFKLILLSEYTLTYNEDSGWQIFDNYGASPLPIPTIDDMTYIQLAGTDTYTGTIPGLISYAQILNKQIGVIVSNPNTGPCSADLGYGAIPFRKFGNSVMNANDLKTDQRIPCVYDGSFLQIVSPTDNIQDDV